MGPTAGVSRTGMGFVSHSRTHLKLPLAAEQLYRSFILKRVGAVGMIVRYHC